MPRANSQPRRSPATLLAQKTAGQEGQKQYYDVSTNENLMRQHGILKRVMLMYEEVIRRIDSRRDFPAQTVIDAAGIVRKFIEDYHEKIEEEHLFPLFRKYYRRDDVLRLYAQKLVDLVDILYQQHPAGRAFRREFTGVRSDRPELALQLDLRHQTEVRSFCEALKSKGLTFGMIDTSDVPNSSDTARV